MNSWLNVIIFSLLTISLMFCFKITNVYFLPVLVHCMVHQKWKYIFGIDFAASENPQFQLFSCTLWQCIAMSDLSGSLQLSLFYRFSLPRPIHLTQARILFTYLSVPWSWTSLFYFSPQFSLFVFAGFILFFKSTCLLVSSPPALVHLPFLSFPTFLSYCLFK